MSGIQDLDDPNQTVFYVPFTGDGGEEEKSDIPLPRSLSYERDLPDGDKIRIDAYTKAWRKCLDRVKSIVQAIQAPIAAEVVQQVHTSYTDILPGLPYPELPVISITNPTSGSSFLEQITSHTDSPNLDSGDATAFTTHLYPGDCVNITSSMKAIIGGFTDRTHILEKAKGRSGASLANYDIETLVAWYTAVRETYELRETCQPQLVVVLHDFEQLDPIVVQDIFYISSLYVSRLPLVFIIALSSPCSPSYLHATYPRATLALLRVRNYTVPSGAQVLEEVITKTFFDVEFEPDIMIGPSVLTILADYCNRQDSSLDTILNILHIAHLKHFSAEPLTVCTTLTPPSNTLAHETSSLFTNALLTRLHPASKPSASDWSQRRLLSLIHSIDDARISFYSRARRLRIGFGILKLVQVFMTNQGYKGLNWDRQSGGMGILDVMNDALRGKLGSDIKYLGTMVRKLKRAQLEALLEVLHVYFRDMPSDVRSSEAEARMKIVLSMNALQSQPDGNVAGAVSEVAASFGEWLVDYMNSLLAPFEESPLWEIWYTGLSPFPVDLINPSLRASVIAGLLHPHDFFGDDERSSFSLWELPDTSILFHRYLDSGRLINLYDWFESFQLEVETQRENLKSKVKPHPRSPVKRGKKGKAKDEESEEKDEEMWKLEVQARFMRALQELDYLGFIKHTGRKADHVQRVAFEMHD